ncbi:MAG TPA: hypothetical protein VJ901_09850 [Thermoanaerobaculia bacterium]|nr:hypothetical protein [Thermoanaerobaculia bacterium]
MTRRGHFPFFLIVLLCAQPLFAQQDDRIQQLEQKLDALVRQANDLRDEINKLKGVAPATPPAEAEDLTKVTEVSPPATQSTAAPALTPALTDVQTINNPINTGASKVFNPDTSVIGNFIGRAGKANPYEFGPNNQRPPMQLDEAEVAFEAFVDPYMKGKFFLSVTPEGIDVEEGYANLLTLPHDLTAKIGKMKATFGKDNTWHTHVRPWVDQPLVIHNFFGDEGLNDRGVSLSKAFTNDFAYVEATGEAFSGDVDDVFARHNNNDLFYNGHVKLFKDISENSNIELGTSYARGNASDALAVTNQFGGVDVTYRWKPLQQGLYRSFIGRFEGVLDDRDDIDHRLKGFYTSADYQLAQRWFTGVRLDRADNLTSGRTDKGVSATLTFWPSEFSQFRTQLRRTSYGGAKSITELLFGMQFSIGAHGAHTF